MRVSKIIISAPLMAPNITIGTALTIMHARNIDVVPVINGQDGINAVTRDDLLSALRGGAFMTTPIADRVTASTQVVSIDEEVSAIAPSSVPALVMKNGEFAGVLSLEAYASGMQSSMTEFRAEVSSIMNSAESGIIAVDMNGKIVVFNRLAETLLGIKSSESLGRNILDVIPNSRLMEIIQSGKPLMGKKFEGLGASVVVNYTPVVRDGNVVGAVGIFQDISHIENISHELSVVKGLNRELEAIIHSSYDGIWVTDGEGRVLDINEAYERITGIKAKEVIGRTMRELVEMGYFDQSVTILVMKELRSITINQTVRGKKQILVTGNPIFSEDGKL
jgi:PAS domain S-box-containing protein